MMGRQDGQRPLYCVMDLDQRVPPGHPLRKVSQLIDFSFVRAEVAPFYGYNGNESVDPVVILKLLFLLFLDDIPSERELMRQVACRLDYLWFLGLDLNDPVPDHSVLSKARSRWGGAVFEKLFVRTVRQCVEAGLVEGHKVHVDASVVDADASKNSVLKGPPLMIAHLKALYAEQEAKLQTQRGRRRKRRPDRKLTSPDQGPRPPGKNQMPQGQDPAPQVDQTVPDPQGPGTELVGPDIPQPAASSAPSELPARPQPADADAAEASGPEASGPGEAPAAQSDPQVKAEVAAQAQPEEQMGSEANAAAQPDAAAKVNDALVCTTDPDAAVTRHAPNCKSGSRPRYMSHRAIDDYAGVITAVASTPGDVNEGSLLIDLLERHECNTEREVEAAVADSQYGTVENYLACQDRGILPHMADLNARQAGSGRRAGIFPDSDFVYDPATDTYRCPAGQTLSPARHHVKRHATDYTPPRGVCAACPLKAQCTRSKTGRSIKRHDRHEAIERARRQSASPVARRNRRRRMHLMERSFADASDNHGLKRSRWRRLWRQSIQDLLIAAVQNVRTLARRRTGPDAATPAASARPFVWGRIGVPATTPTTPARRRRQSARRRPRAAPSVPI